MSQVVKFPTDDEAIRREATSWIAKLDSSELDDKEQQALNEWVARSPQHKATLVRLSKVWDRMSDAGEKLRDESPYVAREPHNTQKVGFYVTHNVYKVAATFVLFLLIPMFMYFSGQDFKGGNANVYTTAIGEQQTISLRDGSEIVLNTDSQVNVDFSGNERLLRLVKGEAIFDVAPNKSRPFTVQTASGDVQALGTSFSVRVEQNVVNVVVSHGTVRVRVNEAADQQSSAEQGIENVAEVIVTKGDKVVFDKQRVESVIRQTDDELDRSLYWRKGFLAFDDEPLSEVVKEVARYTNLDIEIGDDELKNLRVGGYYPIDNLETVFTSLEFNLGLKVQKIGDRYVIKQA